MRRLAQLRESDHAHNRLRIFGVHAYLDTVKVRIKRYLRPGDPQYHAARKVGQLYYRKRRGQRCGLPYLQLKRPTDTDLDRLERFMARYPQSTGISRFDVAVDTQSDSPERLGYEQRTQLILRYRVNKGPMEWHTHTQYWIALVLDPDVNLLHYADRHNKITGELECNHLELRMMYARSVKAAGIKSIKDLRKLNPRAHFLRYVRQTNCGQRSIAQQVQTVRKRLSQDPRRKEFNAQYLAGIERRLKKWKLDRSQMVAQWRPKMAKLWEEQTLLNIIPTKLTIPEGRDQIGLSKRERLRKREQYRGRKKRGDMALEREGRLYASGDQIGVLPYLSQDGFTQAGITHRPIIRPQYSPPH
jgi:hypothetical protein